MNQKKSDPRIQGRLFLVGCPRSGTTFLQSFLAAHPAIESFPESHFFRRLIVPGTRRKTLGLSAPGTRQQMLLFLSKIDRHDLEDLIPRYGIFSHQFTQAFINLLDTITLEADKSYWLEKTPGHVERVDYIEKKVGRVKFVHILRKAEDVIASLYEVSHRYPERWSGQWTIDRCIQRWLDTVQKTLQCVDKPNHHVVIYEGLISEPEPILKKVFNFIQVDFSPDILADRKTVVNQIVSSNEPWKGDVSRDNFHPGARKFLRIFDVDQQAYIRQKVSQLSHEVEKLSLNHSATGVF